MLQYQLVYYSQAKYPFNEQQLIELLTKANQFNRTQDITGCMIYGDGKFVQLLEGEESRVKALYKRIERDNRHHSLVVLLEMSVNQKLFPSWGMAFKYSANKLPEAEGFNDSSQWIYSEFNAEASPGKEALFNFAVRQGLMQSQVLPY